MPIRVLLVEDSPAMRSFVASVLESDGNYLVDEVKDGFDALRLLRGEYDLVITDINMPDINGLELIRAIRQNTRHARTPLIVITTNDRERDVERALSLGATAVLTKPFRPEDLVATAARVTARGPDGPQAAGGAG